MKEQIFRKKSLEKIKSPESLNDYVSVSNPGVWLMIVSVLILLLGACIWGVFGRIESSVQTYAVIEANTASCTVTDSSIQEGMLLRIAKTDFVIRSVQVTETNSVRTYQAVADVTLPDGVYPAEIITESIQPFSFVLN